MVGQTEEKDIRGFIRKEKGVKKDLASKEKEKASVVKAAMFVPYTHHSKLAKCLRELEFSLENIIGHRLKVVEKAGNKLQDLLTSSNPWKGKMCDRPDCMLCDTKTRTGKFLKQECSKRNLVYETKCYTCEERELRKIEENVKDEKEKEKRIKEIRVYKYIGETARSVYERSSEHLSDMTQLKPCSHLLKHIVDVHEEEEIKNIKFNIKVLSYCQSSFERQILESVLIQQERHHHLLNSKAEFNRSAVPRLTTKIGEKHYKKWEKQNEKDEERNEELEEKIRKMRKNRNKERRNPVQKDEPAGKRRKLGGNEYEESRPKWGKPKENETPKRRKIGEEKDERGNLLPPRKKLRQMKIGESLDDNKKDDKPRYSEFGEEPEWEYFDWEGKMRQYKDELEKEERLRKERKEKAEKLEKGWELLRVCRDFIGQNSKKWKEEEEMRQKKKKDEERKQERLREAARKKGIYKEGQLQRKITDSWQTLPQNVREKFVKNEKEMRRQELRIVKENLWKKWRNTRSKERKKGKDETDFERKKTLEERLERLQTIKYRLEKEEETRLERIEKDRERKRTWRKEKDEEDAKKLVREVERWERKEKQRMLEERWILLRWLTDFVDVNTNKWDEEEEGKENEKEEKKLDLKMWEKLPEEKKKEIIREKQEKMRETHGGEKALNEQRKGPPLAQHSSLTHNITSTVLQDTYPLIRTVPRRSAITLTVPSKTDPVRTAHQTGPATPTPAQPSPASSKTDPARTADQTGPATPTQSTPAHSKTDSDWIADQTGPATLTPTQPSPATCKTDPVRTAHQTGTATPSPTQPSTAHSKTDPA